MSKLLCNSKPLAYWYMDQCAVSSNPVPINFYWFLPNPNATGQQVLPLTLSPQFSKPFIQDQNPLKQAL